MIVNKLPVRTWNHLNMNEVRLSDADGAAKKINVCAEKGETREVPIVLDNESLKTDDKRLDIQIEVYAKKDSGINIYLVQMLDENITCLINIECLCEKNAKVELIGISLGGGEVYTDLKVSLNGDGSAFDSEVGYIAEKSEHLDMNYIVKHIGKNTKSRMKVTGVLKDEAFKIFRGSIDFKKGSKGAKGEETEEVLLLSDDVINQTIPLILCSEEEVEGNHGASIGELDEKTLFYLAARGISKQEAEQLLTRARIESVSSKIPFPEIKEKVIKHFL